MSESDNTSVIQVGEEPVTLLNVFDVDPSNQRRSRPASD
jgi:hypothetical protein